jgi:hypothetical protein
MLSADGVAAQSAHSGTPSSSESRRRKRDPYAIRPDAWRAARGSYNVAAVGGGMDAPDGHATLSKPHPAWPSGAYEQASRLELASAPNGRSWAGNRPIRPVRWPRGAVPAGEPKWLGPRLRPV